MERIIRKPFQGVKNIIHFNWHYYVLAAVIMALLYFSIPFAPGYLPGLILLVLFIVFLSVIASLIASWYIYDYSDLYGLDWLNDLKIKEGAFLVNIHAGFDETTSLLAQKYPHSELMVFDFYNPEKHTEISIKRARKMNSPAAQTLRVHTSEVPLREGSVDCVFLILSAHEIRNIHERTDFFKQLSNSLKSEGRIVVAEHLRGINNFLIYTFGVFHFFSETSWKTVFTQASLCVDSQFKITPFITTFILKKNGSTS